MNTDIFKSDRH